MTTLSNGSEIIPITTQDITPLQPSNTTDPGSLDVTIFGSETIGSFIQESVEGIRKVEKEILELFQRIKEDVLVPEDANNKMRIEDVILVAPIAKDYLALLSQQSDNRTKILKTITDLIKANNPSAALFQHFGNGGSGSISPQQVEIQQMLETIQAPKPKEASPAPVRPVFEEEEEANFATQQSSSKKINLIHSYGYKSNNP